MLAALSRHLKQVRAWLRSDMRYLRWILLGLYSLLILGLLGAGLSLPQLALISTLGVTLGGQALFIFGAGYVHLCRPIRRGRLWMPVLVAAAMLAILVLGAGLAIGELLNLHEPSLDRLMNSFLWFFVPASWLVWGVLLWQHCLGRARGGTLSRLTTILFVGSLAELLACIPAHIITSRRPQCLAGLLSMLGIIAGIYVMLFSFGPAIVLLFLRPRYRREQMEGPICEGCGYDLRGTLAALRKQCPECGLAISDEIRANSLTVPTAQ